ncbi:hypothetical protein PF005_g29711 [Phytophthora fragariae]|uniref:Elicitin n=1 Tax=Phytophthora fragariae TaxID=53985 RepID=A0A6A3DD03_9STRA|nr:hypothetical protein PF009_g30101 [Phytophthora fragariae]KAE9064036.1 hypothetical protein PF007_g29334 [Phytophthora fragariae]KAE9165197.1 hypothetical protein PF005_g29711 [Phytophthora fragariae]KAE9168081.1 hypothetical protein PF004_g28612 [Phytophthora fragariae]
MKFTAVLAATVAALVGSVNATACTSTQQTAAYIALVSILSKSSFTQCSKDSGYSMLTATSLPTTAQYKLMCASTACESMIATISSLNPPNCDLTVPTSGLVLNVYEYANGFSSTCASLTATTAPPTTAPAATAAASADGSASNSTVAPLRQIVRQLKAKDHAKMPSNIFPRPSLSSASCFNFRISGTEKWWR